VIERLLKIRNPWPVNRNPVYAIAEGQRITRTEDIGLTDIRLTRNEKQPQMRPSPVSEMGIMGWSAAEPANLS
jgi:hypothetical protein